MEKVIEKLNINGFKYQIGYDLFDNKVHLFIKIYKDKVLLVGGCWYNEMFGSLLGFSNAYFASYKIKDVSTIKEMFIELRQYSDVPEEVERKYESLFLMYKLNDFNEL
jgi:hypothetical protein